MPSRPVEHLVFWPVIVAGLVVLHFVVTHIVALAHPTIAATADVMVSIFGNWAVVIFYAVLLPVCFGLYRWGGNRKPSAAHSQPPED